MPIISTQEIEKSWQWLNKMMFKFKKRMKAFRVVKNLNCANKFKLLLFFISKGYCSKFCEDVVRFDFLR